MPGPSDQGRRFEGSWTAVEEDLRARGLAQVKSDEVGRAILKPLRDLDEVAYMRFASVYQNFENLEDFQNAIDELKADTLK